MELFQAVTVGEAKRRLAAGWPTCGEETVSLERAAGRVLAESPASPLDLPPFTRSTVDGFAVRAADTFGASASLPAYLSLAGEVRIGHPFAGRVQSGEAVTIPTGGQLPEGADAAVMIENTEPVDERTVAVLRPAAPGENLILQGEDLRSGQAVLPAGRRLRPADLALLAACGFREVRVRLPLRVGIVSTGDELVVPGAPLPPGCIYDSNSYSLFGLVSADGGLPTLYGPVEDDLARLRQTVEEALAVNQLVLLSGGSSVGVRDYTLTVLEELGGRILFHGVAVGPGKPTLAASLPGRLLVGLPGHPASALVVYTVLLSPLVIRGSYPDPDRPVISARLDRSLASRTGREDYVPVRLAGREGETWAEPLLGKSGLIALLTQAQGLARIPLEEEGKAWGDPVEVMLF
ncbi:MAG: molybdopterin molybdotransferase MoeA [Clostridia bacterium]|nr:molybdopterin molybdotransferase MoeA [Clostridia bacterium]MDH7572080.1 molybdopterin molybdotransferase MoeA [Clostridia bacterium]